jgi:hypothetical protein
MTDSTACRGYSPFHIQTMLDLCRTCPFQVACRQRAADTPFRFVDQQVWGGLVLPRDNHLLPRRSRPTTEEVERRPRGRPEWFEGGGVDPDSCGSGRVTRSKGSLL